MAIHVVKEPVPKPGTLGRTELYALAIGQVIGAGVIHGNQLILFKVLVQHGVQRLKKPHGLGTIVVQVDHSRDKILFFICHTHTFNTSSRSYTVLILPESTLTSIGSVFITRTTVGRESSISLAFKIGFMLNRLP